VLTLVKIKVRVDRLLERQGLFACHLTEADSAVFVHRDNAGVEFLLEGNCESQINYNCGKSDDCG
jgi:hypothetical protein